MKIPDKRGRKPLVDVQEVETQASPSLENEKLSSPSVASHSLSERLTRSQSAMKAQENIQHIAQIIEDIKVLARRKKIKDNLQLYHTCHSCHVLLKTDFLACCSHESCSRYFCFRCLNKTYKKSLKDIYDITQTSVWGCVSCQGLCKCQLCKNNGRATAQRRKFPSELVQKKEFSVSSQGSQAGNDILIKKEAIEELSLSEQVTDIFEPMLLVKEELTVKFDFVQTSETALTIPPCKPIRLRSRALAKIFQSHKKSQDSDEDMSEEDEEEKMSDNIQETEMEVNSSKRTRRANKNYSTRNALLAVKEEEQSETTQSMTKGPCHICQKVTNKSERATCSIQSCQKHYCVSCIQEIQRKDFDLRKDYNPKFWICFSCGGLCECSKCSRRREAGKRRTQAIQNVYGEFQQSATKASKLLVKRRIKYYDTLSEDEEEQIQQSQPTLRFKVEEVEEDLGCGINQSKQIKIEELSTIKSLHQRHIVRKKMYGNSALTEIDSSNMCS